MFDEYNSYESNNAQGSSPESRPAADPETQSFGLSIAALIFGLLSFMTLTTFFLPIFLGSLSVIFALLSRGRCRKMLGIAKAGLIASCISLGIVIGMIATVSYMFLSNPAYSSIFREMYKDMYEYYENNGEYPDINRYLPDNGNYDTL